MFVTERVGNVLVFESGAPSARRVGHYSLPDVRAQGESGLMDLTGFPEGPPVKVGTSIADLVSGIEACHGVVLALYAREKTQTGQKVEIAMLDVMASLLTYQAGIYFATGQRPTRRGNQHPSIVPYEVLRAADAYLTVGVANNSLWERLCQALERPELQRDPRFDTEAKRVQARDALIPLLNEIFSTRRAEEWLERLDKAGVPAGRIKTVAEVCESPHLKARGMIVSVPHPKAGTLTVFGLPIRLWATPGAVTEPPPLLGQHTEEILTRVAGLSRDEVARLRQRGVC